MTTINLTTMNNIIEILAAQHAMAHHCDNAIEVMLPYVDSGEWYNVDLEELVACGGLAGLIEYYCEGIDEDVAEQAAKGAKYRNPQGPLANLSGAIKAGDPVIDYLDEAIELAGRHSEDAVFACDKLGYNLDALDDYYQGEWNSTEDFAKDKGLDDLPAKFINSIDWQAYWDSELRHEYVEHDGHFFECH